ncbi:unnamed protein product [Tetraodon nigroviridis]|uniref:Chromosome 7 SCAF14601, whole genome shotgun sequence n=1 Tax=Tetraodon nigroviridis TaxID=99883 RepID=Q4SFL3_TETNG|nr:unnamed protein product [Tetraodon nigroviridis]
MKNKGIKQKSKKKGSDNAFGCDLIEHLESSGQDVPQVLKTCAEFIEEHGVVDGIYRLSGVTSNIQRLRYTHSTAASYFFHKCACNIKSVCVDLLFLFSRLKCVCVSVCAFRQEFNSEACPDLRKEVYLQDIHCVGSLCKLYFRELPNPLLTYELYGKFTDVVRVQGEHERLLHIRRVVKELPAPHFRTLEFLTKHLAHLATFSTQTNMHTRNLALVWAPNLCKDMEVSADNGDMAFQAVRIQQSVVEFILNHTEQIFSSDSALIKPKEGAGLMCSEKYATLPIGGQCGPMKLMSLEEAQARSLSPNHPVHRERQRENSLPDTSTATLYHTVIDINSKRKLSGKSKKWRSIFNLGRSVDSKGKLNRNGSVFIRTPGITEKAALRPSRSMESLCSLPTEALTTSRSPATANQNPNWTSLPSRGSANVTKGSAPKQKNTLSTQRFYRQMSFEAAAPESREEHFSARHRPYSLNLDSGHRCIRDISNQQNRNLSELSSCQRGSLTSSGGANNGPPSDLELFLSDRQAPLRRNSAPVSVSSVRTAFMIKTCQAKAVPVIPPRVQYSQIPHSRQDPDADAARLQDRDQQKPSTEKSNPASSPMADLQEELENKEPAPKHQKQANVEKCAESARTTSTPELPVITRRHAPGLEVFVDGPRPNRGNILQRPSFRNRQRPQSLILLSPPFPIMDHPPSGDDGKLKSLNDTTAGNAKGAAENYRMAEGIALQGKMTIPKSGQRLETSTSCFYQPQRRSMIFESRSQRQIE